MNVAINILSMLAAVPVGAGIITWSRVLSKLNDALSRTPAQLPPTVVSFPRITSMVVSYVGTQSCVV
jgi:hypothetical protein